MTNNIVNKGKYFYNCSECPDFFKWADEVPSVGRSGWANAAIGRSSTSSSSKSVIFAEGSCNLCDENVFFW